MITNNVQLLIIIINFNCHAYFILTVFVQLSYSHSYSYMENEILRYLHIVVEATTKLLYCSLCYVMLVVEVNTICYHATFVYYHTILLYGHVNTNPKKRSNLSSSFHQENRPGENNKPTLPATNTKPHQQHQHPLSSSAASCLLPPLLQETPSLPFPNKSLPPTRHRCNKVSSVPLARMEVVRTNYSSANKRAPFSPVAHPPPSSIAHLLIEFDARSHAPLFFLCRCCCLLCTRSLT